MKNGVMTLLRIVGFAGRYQWLLLAGYIFITADVFFSVGIVVAVQSIINALADSRVEELYKLLIFSAAGMFASLGLSILGSGMRRYAAIQANKRMTNIVLSHVNKLPFKFFQDSHSGDLVERVNTDVGKATDVIHGGIVSLVTNLLISASSFVYLSKIDFKLALLAVATGPITFFSGRFFDSRIRKTSEELDNKGGELRSLLQEFLQAMPVVRALGLENVFVNKFRKQKDSQLQLVKRKALFNTIMWRIVTIVNASVTILLTYLIASSAINGIMSIGAVLSFLFLLGRLQWPFIHISSTWGTIHNSLGSADRVFKILDMETEPIDTGHRQQISERHDVSADEYAIVIQNLSFSYHDGKCLFDGLNLNVKKGETVAIVGASGSGKTTLARLCCGLFIPDGGDIKVFGYSIRNDLRQARECLAYVPQTPYVFTGSIRDNISYGCKQKGPHGIEPIQEAAVMANADTFIREMKDGYETVLKEHGSNLSGGQKQRLTIARALIRNAPLLIFDEATSSLDNESEQLIKDTVEGLMGKKTMLVIAHRLSTVRNASRIIFLDQGRIVEEGTHDELLEARGAYYKLYNEGGLTA